MKWAVMLWSHCRNINVTVFKDTIRYSIPVYSEKDMIGSIKSVNMKHGTLEIIFHTTKAPEDKSLLK